MHILLLIFTILLSACGSQKSPESESFSIKEPKVLSFTKKSSSRFNDYKTAGRPKLHLLDQIQFEDTVKAFVLLSHSKCTDAETQQSVENHVTVDRPKNLAIEQLVPFQVIDWVDDNKNIICDFNFSARSGNGSVHNFQWTQQKIESGYESHLLLFDNNLNPVTEKQFIAYPDFKYFSFQRNPKLIYRLECQDFLLERLSDLQDIDKLLPVDQLLKQNFKCHLTEKTSGNLLISYSPAFYITMKSTGLEVTKRDESVPYSANAVDPLINWEIKNTSDHEKILHLSISDDKLPANLTEVGVSPRGEVVNTTYYEITLGLQLTQNENLILPANSQISLSLLARKSRICANPNGMILGDNSDFYVDVSEVRPDSAMIDDLQILKKVRLTLPTNYWLPGKYAKAGVPGHPPVYETTPHPGGRIARQLYCH